MQLDCVISPKQKNQAKKPSKAYYDITFSSKDKGFNYIIFQNFYVAAITIKQYQGESDSKAELEKKDNWRTILSNYKLMKNAHFEGDAQNWHIIGAELFNDKFDRSNLSIFRIFLNAPSPSWLDFYLKNISVYYKKASFTYKPPKTVKRTPFGEFRKALKDNLKVIKKSSLNKGENGASEYGTSMSGLN